MCSSDLGVLLNEGKDNEIIKTIWENAPKNEGPEAVFDKVRINPQSLMPAALNFWNYEGSLTTPPCTEGVSWYVMRQTVDISYKQLAAFKKLYKSNSRPTQPLNGRRVMEYFEQQ